MALSPPARRSPQNPAAPRFRRLTKTESIVISTNSCWTGCAANPSGQVADAVRRNDLGLFFVANQDFNGLRRRLRRPIVFADVRTLKAFCA